MRKIFKRKFSRFLVCSFLGLLVVTIIAVKISQAAVIYTLSNDYFKVEIGSYGEISSLKLTGDIFPTNYVMNATNSPKQDTSDHQWLGELMFKYRLGTGAWTTALTDLSGDARKLSRSGNTVNVTYQNSGNSQGIRNFRLIETYSLVDDYLYWEIKVKNTSSQNIEIGDFGLPLPFNEKWPGNEAIYETRVVDHSFTGNNSSYIYVTRPSGIGSFLLMTPDSSTGAGFEYQDHWRTQEHSNSTWCQDQGDWANGLNVFYIHSNVIKSTGRGYLPNTSLTLAPKQEKVYAFKFHKMVNLDAMKDKLYEEGLIDVNVVPGMIVPTNQTAKFDLHTIKAINSITPQYPSETTVTYINTTTNNHRIYQVKFKHLGQNNLTVNYGNGEKTVLQFYAVEPIGDALQRHATFMVEKTQWNDASKGYNKVFDDWMMDTKAKRGEFYGYWGWGDDWGYTHGQFLAEKNVLNPVAKEVTALDAYLETAIWNTLMNGHHADYLIHDFYKAEPNDTPTYRGYAYPHIYNTYFGMYKIAKLYPNLITYKNTRATYLLRAYNIFKALYDGAGVSYNWNTGLMGESTTPEIIQALLDEGYTNQATELKNKMWTKYNNFRNTKYPYGSEYSYDNTGEEAVYTLAKMNNNTTMMSKINQKTRACRGTQPVWYYYADPVTICGENWWNFQYTASLAGYCMDDWMKYNSTTPEVDARLAYAAKVANISCINSGQIDSNAANIGAVSWTYQAEKGNLGGQGVGEGSLHNGWRQMSGEADLGLFGAIRILSADVAVDPVFGLYGYGCDVSANGSDYVITPKDGIFKRLNLLTQKLYMELDRDQYTSATVATEKNHVQFTLKNQYTLGTHTTKVTLTGLAAGTYDVLVNNAKAGSVKAVNGQKTVVSLNIGTAATYDIKITTGDGSPTSNTAPTVDAGGDKTLTSLSNIVLNGTTSDDGLPSGSNLTATWSLQSGPGTATFTNAKALDTSATVTKAGTYVFKLTASDGALSSSDTVTVTVKTSTSDLTNIAPLGTASTSYCSSWESIIALNDGYEPTRSNDRNHKVYGNWNKPGTTQWVQYDFSKNYTISKCDVYWFDDDQGIDLPASCSIQYWNGSAWVKVSNPAGLGVTKNQYNTTTFTAVTTNKIRLNITAKTSYSTGILEWKVWSSSGGTAPINTSGNPNSPVLTTPPSWADPFYKKCVYSYNIPILSSNKVKDKALIQAYWIVDAMLKKIAVDKPHILKKMINNRSRINIVGLTEHNVDLPEWKNWSNRTERRAGGGIDCTTLEEELIPNSQYLTDFCVTVHEFAHTILMSGIGDADHTGADSALYQKILRCYNNAIAKNLYTESSYDRNNYHEYWAGQVPRWFNANPTNLNVPNVRSLTDREQLKIYDSDIYNLITTVFGDYKLPTPFNK